MSKLQIILPIKPISYNAYFRNSKTGKRIKTGLGLAFDEEVVMLLEDHASALKSFGELIDPSKNIVGLTLSVGNPDFFLKDRSRISKTCGDIDNYLKVLQDKLFKTMDRDDYITRKIVVSDAYCPEPFSKITLEILPIPQELDRPEV